MSEPLPVDELLQVEPLHPIDLGLIPMTISDFLFVATAASERRQSFGEFVRDALIREAAA